jgi:hypothetical protein
METSGGKIYVYRTETQDKYCPVHGCQKDRTKQVGDILTVQYTAVKRTGLSRYGIIAAQYTAVRRTGLSR